MVEPYDGSLKGCALQIIDMINGSSSQVQMKFTKSAPDPILTGEMALQISYTKCANITLYC
jgi:hypothetical protein